jgi:predicted DNA-binding transcriptional regulator AlpA
MKTALAKPSLTGRTIRLPRVVELTAASRATIWRWVKDDLTFPRPFHLSKGITVWCEEEVLGWLHAKKAQRGLR